MGKIRGARWLLLGFLSILLPACNQDVEEQMDEIQQTVQIVDFLESEDLLDAEAAGSIRSEFVERAKTVSGEDLTLEGLRNWEAHQRVIKISWVLGIAAGIIGAGAVIGIFTLYLGRLLAAIPLLVWEILAYMASFGFIFGSEIFPLNIFGCLLLIGSFSMTWHFHLKESERFKVGNFTSLASLGCVIVWGIAAYMKANAVIGFGTIMALESFLGFSFAVMPLCYMIGFKDEHAVARGTVASLALMVFGVVLNRFAPAHVAEMMLPFQTGLLFMGTFVYFLGLLIVSSKYYSDDDNYLRMQIVVALSGCAALAFGSLLDLNSVFAIGTTFFSIWLIEKYVEIAWNKEHIVWSALGLAVMIGALAWAMNEYPQQFMFWA